MVPTRLLIFGISTGGHGSRSRAEAAFSFGMQFNTFPDGRDVKTFQTILRLSTEVLDHVLARSEEEAVVMCHNVGDLVPRHVSHLVRVDVLPLAGYVGVRPPTIGLDGDDVGLAEDAGTSTPSYRGGSLSSEEKYYHF